MEFPVQRWDISSLRAILLQPIPPSQSPARADVVEGTLDVFCEFRKFKPRLCQYDTSNQVFSWQNLDEDRSPSAKVFALFDVLFYFICFFQGSLVVTFVSELELDVTTYKLKYRASHKFDIELAEMVVFSLGVFRWIGIALIVFFCRPPTSIFRSGQRLACNFAALAT